MAFSSALADGSPPLPTTYRLEPYDDIGPLSPSVCLSACCGGFIAYSEVVSHARMRKRA
jgi:hypothetical protein